MALTENIIYFAAQQGGSFKKKELLDALRMDASVNEASLSALLGRLVATGRMTKTGWGEYSLPEGVKSRFQVRPGNEALGIGKTY